MSPNEVFTILLFGNFTLLAGDDRDTGAETKMQGEMACSKGILSALLPDAYLKIFFKNPHSVVLLKVSSDRMTKFHN